MNARKKSEKRVRSKRSILRSTLLTMPMFLIVWMMILQGRAPEGNLAGVSAIVSIAFMTTIFFLMVRTGQTYKYRKLFFVVAAFCFPIPFITHFLELRGSMSFDAEAVLSSSIPFCHLVIPMILVPAALTKTILFPGSLLEGFANISSMLVIWIGVSVALGRGWCSWACFYGGLDEGFTYLNKKPKLKIDRQWAYLPYAVLIAIVLTAAATLSPTYCEWICPFKTVTEFPEIASLRTLVQTGIFVSLFIALVVVLPILTGKRTQCTILCPFAAFQSLTNKLNIFEVRIDPEKCTKCKTCVDACPTLSIDQKSCDKGKTLLSCTKCGRCVDDCLWGAVSYHIRGTPIGLRVDLARTLFMYTAFVFAAAIGGSMILGAVRRILQLAATGSMLS